MFLPLYNQRDSYTTYYFLQDINLTSSFSKKINKKITTKKLTASPHLKNSGGKTKRRYWAAD